MANSLITPHYLPRATTHKSLTSYETPDSEPHPSLVRDKGGGVSMYIQYIPSLPSLPSLPITNIHLILCMCKSVLPVYTSLPARSFPRKLNNLVSHLCLHISIYQKKNPPFCTHRPSVHFPLLSYYFNPSSHGMRHSINWTPKVDLASVPCNPSSQSENHAWTKYLPVITKLMREKFTLSKQR